MLGSAGVRRRGAWPGVVLLAAAALSWSTPLSAEPAEEPTFSLAYTAPEGCPARGTFARSILARAPGAREAEGAAALAFDVKLEPDGELTRGTFSVRFVHGEHFEREVPAARCVEVTTSMAIMAGLLLSGALLPEPEAAAPPAASPPPAPPPLASPSSEPSASSATSSPPAVASPRPSPAPAEAAEPWRLRPGALVHGELGLGALPLPSVGLSLGAELWLERRSPWSPSLRAGFHGERATAASSRGRGVFALDALLVRGCPLRIARFERSALGLCGLFEWGSLRVAARGTDHPLDRSMPWVALGGSARLEGGLGDHFALEAELSGFGLLHHDRFVFQPGNASLHDVPAASGGLSFGLLYRPL